MILLDQFGDIAGAQAVLLDLVEGLCGTGRYEVGVMAPEGRLLGEAAARGAWSVKLDRRRAISTALFAGRPFGDLKVVVANGPRVLPICMLASFRWSVPCVLYLHSRPTRR